MISFVIPAYNEVEAIGGVINDIIKAVEDSENLSEFEIIVVDDGSTDGTGDVAKNLGAHVIWHPLKAGYGRSLKDGIRASKYDLIGITDADGTYPVDQFPKLAAQIDAGFDMAVGTRTGKEYRESIWKYPLRKVLQILVEFTTGRRIPDVNSGLRIFRRKDAELYFSQLCDTFSFTTSLTLAYMMNGKFITYQPIPYYSRIGKTKVRLIKDSLATLQYIIQAILYYNPIKLFLSISILTFLVSVIVFLLGLFFEVDGTQYVMLGGLFLGILIFSLGLLADVLRQIMEK